MSLVETQGAQADYNYGCGYGYSGSGSFGYGSSYGYGYGLNNVYGFGYGYQVCPTTTTTGGGGGGGGSVATTTTTNQPTTTTTLPTTTTTTRTPGQPGLLPLRLYFANDSAVLTTYDKDVLNNLGSQIVSHQTSHLNITGWASHIGTLPINFPLSLHRARVVEAYLIRVLNGRGYSSITFTVRGNGVLKTFPNLALDRVVIVSA